MAGTTQLGSSHGPAASQLPVPGLVLVWCDRQPLWRVVSLPAQPLVLGREDFGGLPVADQRVSGRHAQLTFEGGAFVVRDLGSKGGTFVNGEKVQSARVSGGALVRVGYTLLLLLDDVRPYLAGKMDLEGGEVVGPMLKRELDRLVTYAQENLPVLITGENGTGKELAARRFHRAARVKGELVPVNCANLLRGSAAAELFGVGKGVFTEVKERRGLIDVADGGVLFLDELGELEPDVQATLLRVVQTGEVAPAGATTTHPVKVRYVSATNSDLRAAVQARSFREDLFHRLCDCTVRLPPLRERREEIPWLLTEALARGPKRRTPHALFVQEALLRSWPGNVRELLHHADISGANAGESEVVRVEHLDPNGGMPRLSGAVPTAPQPATGAYQAFSGEERAQPTCDQLREAMARHGGNVSAAARALSLHRTQMYRLLTRCGLRVAEGPTEDGE